MKILTPKNTSCVKLHTMDFNTQFFFFHIRSCRRKIKLCMICGHRKLFVSCTFQIKLSLISGGLWFYSRLIMIKFIVELFISLNCHLSPWSLMYSVEVFTETFWWRHQSIHTIRLISLAIVLCSIKPWMVPWTSEMGTVQKLSSIIVCLLFVIQKERIVTSA